MSKESKEKVSVAKKGTSPWNKGKKMSDTMRLKMKGNKNGASNKGRKFNPETLRKMSVAKIGKPSNSKGSKRSHEARVLMSISRRKYLSGLSPTYDYRLDSKTRKGNKRIRRERLKKFGGSHTQEEWNILKKRCNFSCLSCKKSEPKIKLTRDHIVSLSNGGSDNIENIQPLCNSCNAKKYTQTIKY